MMTELEKMQRAKMYVDNLARGVNPLTGQPVPDAELINNVRISRCLFYVSDVLGQVIECGGVAPKKKKAAKLPFCLDYETRAGYELSSAPIPVSEITRRINSLIDEEAMRKLKYTSITGWLLRAGFLREVPSPEGKTEKRPTQAGEDVGISLEQRTGLHGNYTVVVYSAQAQQFLMDNLDAVIEINNEKAPAPDAPAENRGQTWSQA